MVGEFAADPAIVSSANSRNDNDARGRADGQPRLGSHGIRVGDVVRVSDVSAGSVKKVGKEKEKDGGGGKDGVEGVVTRVNEKAIWIAFGQQGGGGRSKEDDEAIEDLWGKKLWAYVLLGCLSGDFDLLIWRIGSNLLMTLLIEGKKQV